MRTEGIPASLINGNTLKNVSEWLRLKVGCRNSFGMLFKSASLPSETGKVVIKTINQKVFEDVSTAGF